MRRSKYYIPTQKEIPQDAEIKSHIIMIKGGYIRKLSAGIYTLLPIAQKIMIKIANIVRKHMNNAGFSELVMPIVSPKELWEETGRYDIYGKEMMKFNDRHKREFVLGPTHEEIITDLVRKTVKSYKELPLGLYQIQTKFRDEIRPRFGIMRGREFLMKDAYSFDSTKEHAVTTYKKVEKAYNDIFSEMELEFSEVAAQSGPIGGDTSKEFMVHADVGESIILKCEKCGYVSNNEKTELVEIKNEKEVPAPMEDIETVNIKTVEAVSGFLNVNKSKIVKTILVRAADKFIAVLLRGDRDLNMDKLNNILGVDASELALEKDFVKLNLPSGFIGPFELPIKDIYADISVKDLCNFVIGANKKDHHFKNVNIGRDINIDKYYDLSFAIEGDKCPKCGGSLDSFHGIEVGHIFILGNKYSKSMKAFFVDDAGKRQNFEMGCYGIGIGRTMASIIEQKYSKEKGMYWPLCVAPCDIDILLLNTSDEALVKVGDELYNELGKTGIDTIIDDRNINAGVKFAESDLLGAPIKIVIGRKYLENKKFEVVYRKNNEKQFMDHDTLIKYIKEIIGIKI
ncbi:proline--tRNA ligase [bacterium]|nr:proline--tRNA ligase [bacterium]